MAHQNLGYFPHDRVNWRLGLVTSFQAYHRHSRPISLAFTILSRPVVFVIFFGEKIFSFYSHFYSTMSSSDGSLASSSSEDTDVDVADKDLEVEGSPNSSTQGSNQEAELGKSPTLGRHKLQCSLFATLSRHSPPSILKIGL